MHNRSSLLGVPSTLIIDTRCSSEDSEKNNG